MPHKDYSEICVAKPWGHEYLAYQNEHLGIWMLHIKENCKTSMHCHPKKNTGLVCLAGAVEVSFLKNKIPLKGIDKIMIFRGRFHSTQALSPGGSWVLEVESPQDKHDLVRLNDDHGRAGQAYEGKTCESPRTDDMLRIERPSEADPWTDTFRGAKMTSRVITDVSQLYNRPYFEVSVILTGGLQTPQGDKVVQIGDCIAGHSLNYLAPHFELVPGTQLLSIEKND
jgi:hypothetical protein